MPEIPLTTEQLLLIVAIISMLGFILLVVLLVRLNKLEGQDQNIRDEFDRARSEQAEQAKRQREELAESSKRASDSLIPTIQAFGKLQETSTSNLENRVKTLVETNEKRLNELQKSMAEQLLQLRSTMEQQIEKLSDKNQKKLDEMRQVVDEKLQSTLNKRLGESFKLVSERLEAVQKGLGEMQHLATGVGDLKRVLTNVKSRGTWGEYQLMDLIEQVLTPSQYDTNVKPHPDSTKSVECAIKLPGQDSADDIWLPIDSKFPTESYQRVVDASDSGDSELVKLAVAELLRAIEGFAKDISGKYISPPHTTDFAIMFLPTEGLYTEVIRNPNIVEKLQLKYRIVVAGPTTLTAILNSLRMGFRTLAIEKRSSEVWQILAAVKMEFGKFGEVLDKVKKQLNTASKTLETTGTRSRAIERKLRDVEELPDANSSSLLNLDKITGIDEQQE